GTLKQSRVFLSHAWTARQARRIKPNLIIKNGHGRIIFCGEELRTDYLVPAQVNSLFVMALCLLFFCYVHITVTLRIYPVNSQP
ncbi:MAG: hypothetical protein LUC94_14875, partial [Clostridiales bacterium]|nr:hypothetical protein [Clostridiales bacterium]